MIFKCDLCGGKGRIRREGDFLLCVYCRKIPQLRNVDPDLDSVTRLYIMREVVKWFQKRNIKN